ncbi:MAG TPA: hypothetical protein VKG45_08500 [Actinomycetes bacterium]|nr:hypothetical protein [Actinomycetes bacterium]
MRAHSRPAARPARRRGVRATRGAGSAVCERVDALLSGEISLPWNRRRRTSAPVTTTLAGLLALAVVSLFNGSQVAMGLWDYAEFGGQLADLCWVAFWALMSVVPLVLSVMAIRRTRHLSTGGRVEAVATVLVVSGVATAILWSVILAVLRLYTLALLSGIL